jgi:hypothetical protein
LQSHAFRLLLPQPPSAFLPKQFVSLSQSSSVSPVEFTHGRGWAWSIVLSSAHSFLLVFRLHSTPFFIPPSSAIPFCPRSPLSVFLSSFIFSQHSSSFLLICLSSVFPLKSPSCSFFLLVSSCRKSPFLFLCIFRPIPVSLPS